MRVTQVAGVLADPVRAARVVAWRLRDDPVKVAVAALAAVPAPLAGGLARLAGRPGVFRLMPATATLLLDRAARPGLAGELAGDLAVRVARRPGRRSGRRLALVLASLGRAEHAEALHTLSTTEAGRGAAARSAYAEGRISEAIDLLAECGARPWAHRMAEIYAGELAVLSDPVPEPLPPAGSPGRPADPGPARPPGGRTGPVPRADPAPGRVLHCVTNALPYTQAGYTIRTHRIVLAQRAAGLDPHVVTGWGWPELQGRFGTPATTRLDGIPYHRLPPHGPIPVRADQRLARGAAELAGLVTRLRPRLLHAATDHRTGGAAVAAARRTGLPVVYEVRGFLEETWLSRRPPEAVDSERFRLQRAAETAVMRAADAVVTLAETMRAEIVSRGVPASAVFLAPNAVDPAMLTLTPDRAGRRRSYGIGEREFVVGSLSNLAGYEGFHTLLEAVALLRDQGIPVRVLLAGDGAQRSRLERLAHDLGITDRVVFAGRVPPEETIAVHAALDVFCVPRADHRVCRLVTPLKPVEAMALGVPVVASDLPALAELLEGGRAGLLVPPDDAGALAKALAGLREDGRLRAELGAAGRDAVSRLRTWDRVMRTYVDVYRKVAGP